MYLPVYRSVTVCIFIPLALYLYLALPLTLRNHICLHLLLSSFQYFFVTYNLPASLSLFPIIFLFLSVNLDHSLSICNTLSLYLCCSLHIIMSLGPYYSLHFIHCITVSMYLCQSLHFSVTMHLPWSLSNLISLSCIHPYLFTSTSLCLFNYITLSPSYPLPISIFT